VNCNHSIVHIGSLGTESKYQQYIDTTDPDLYGWTLQDLVPLNRREPDDYRSSVNTRSVRRSTIIKVKLMFSGSTTPRMEKEHLAKLAHVSQ
jgi:hypothetical protein